MTKWELSGSYYSAIRGCEMIATHHLSSPDWIKDALNIKQLLELAHVANLDVAQFRALPPSIDDLLNYEPDHRLPFNPLYISIGNGYEETTSGILMAVDNNDQIYICGFWSSTLSRQERVSLPMIGVNPHSHTYRDYSIDMIGESEDSLAAAHSGASDAVKVIRFLESANVEIDETPVTRQVKRNAERKKLKIAYTVRVREPRRRRIANSEQTEHRTFSHRFEVAGHYAHYPPDTRLFKATERDRPHKILIHPTRGRVVRIWIPDHVKGPSDKPLVPKTRLYKLKPE